MALEGWNLWDGKDKGRCGAGGGIWIQRHDAAEDSSDLEEFTHTYVFLLVMLHICQSPPQKEWDRQHTYIYLFASTCMLFRGLLLSEEAALVV